MDQRVSIVIPTFNDDPAHLAESVGSARAQTYPDVEVVVVDDGSTRVDSLAALAQLDGVRVIHQANAGPGSALNTGIRASTGALVLPLGADDRLDNYFVTHCVETLGRSPDIVGVFPLVEFFGLRSGVMQAPDEVALLDIVVRNKMVAATLYRREHWELVGGYGEFDDCSEDWYFFALLLARTGGRFVREPRARFFYRIRASSWNSVNRGVERKENLRRHLVTALPESVPAMYLAAAREADEAIADADKYGSYVKGWKKRLGPLMRLYWITKKVRHAVTDRVRS